MDLMIKLDGTRVLLIRSRSRKLGVPAGEAVDTRGHSQTAALRFQAAVALRATCIVDASQRDFSRVLHMATGALRREHLLGLMHRPVVTRLTRLIRDLCRKRALRCMAGRA